MQVDFLAEVELDHAEVLQLHLLALHFASQRKDFIFFGRLLRFGFSNTCHQRVILFSQLDLVLLGES